MANVERVGLTFRQRLLKRILDVSLSSVLVVLLLPFLVILAALVRLSSRGPALYRHERVGRDGAIIHVLKFRTMHDARLEAGPPMTVAGDPRVTPLGQYLRRTKLDELPQLWNVLKGEMSLVGPRPDVPGYADRLTGPAALLIGLRPGVTGAAALYLRNEEETLAAVTDPQAYNDEVLYPLKVRIDLAYLEHWSLARDIGYIAVTALPLLDRYVQLIPTDSYVASLSDDAGSPDTD